MNAEKNGRKNPNSTIIRRTSISEEGSITESEIPLSKLKVEAIDLSAGSNSPTTLLLTRDAAMKITEQAISSALDNAWSKLVNESQNDSSASEKETKSITETEKSIVEKAPKTGRGYVNPQSTEAISGSESRSTENGKRLNVSSQFSKRTRDSKTEKVNQQPTPKPIGGQGGKTLSKSYPGLKEEKKPEQLLTGMRKTASGPSPSSKKETRDRQRER